MSEDTKHAATQTKLSAAWVCTRAGRQALLLLLLHQQLVTGRMAMNHGSVYGG